MHDHDELFPLDGPMMLKDGLIVLAMLTGAAACIVVGAVGLSCVLSWLFV